MKNLILFFLLLSIRCSAQVLASNNAADYGGWGIPSVTPNTYVFTPAATCNVNVWSQTFSPFSTNASVFIDDDDDDFSEAVTPSTIVATGTQCGFTATTVHNHTNFVLHSGTGGLQECLNILLSDTVSYSGPVYLNAVWYAQTNAVTGASPSAVIAAAKGSTNINLVDITTSPVTTYTWNGTAYVKYGFTGTKTAGSCVITWVNGIATTVTGC